MIIWCVCVSLCGYVSACMCVYRDLICVRACVCISIHNSFLDSSPLIPPQAVHLAQTDCEAQQSPENWVN